MASFGVKARRVAAAAAALLAVGVIAVPDRPSPDRPANGTVAGATASGTASAISGGASNPASPASLPTSPALVAGRPVDAGGAPAAMPGGKPFRVDATGRLVVDGDTLLHVEALVALTPPDQLRAAAQRQAEGVPAAAAAEALDLVERYNVYQQAQKLSFAPGAVPLVPEQGLAELDGVHALRVSHFGQATAEALFGADEAVARRLLELMRQDTAPGLTMEQKAARAQAAYQAELEATPPPAVTPR